MVYRNVNELIVDLYRLPEEELYQLSGQNQWQIWDSYAMPNSDRNKVWSRTYDASGSENVAIRQIITLTADSGELLPTGAYYLSVSAPNSLKTDDYELSGNAAIILSDANLVLKKSQDGESMAWLTDLSSGLPISDAPVKFSIDGQQVGLLSTDADGIVIGEMDMYDGSSWIPLIAISGKEGQADYAVASSEWNSGITAWDFELSQGYGSEQHKGHFYTERPIYRPGDTVYWKGIIRTMHENEYALPVSDLPVYVTIRDDMGNVLYEASETLNEMGTVNGEVQLSPEAVTGYYYLEARIGPEGVSQTYSGAGFQVASYHKPEFEIAVTSTEPEYIQGDTVTIEASTSYFSGSPLADSEVTWRLIAEPYFFSWAVDEGYRYSFSPYDPDSDIYDPYKGLYAQGMITEGSGVTDAEGNFRLEVPADIGQSLQSQTWTFDVTIQSPTNQFVSGSVRVPIHQAAFYIGIAPQSYVNSVGEAALIDLITLIPDYQPYAGAELTAIVVDYEWNSVYEKAADGSYRWETSVERTPVYTTTLTTNRDGEALLEWTAEEPGQYQIVVSGEDDAGNSTSSVGFIWVSSSEQDQYVAWPMQNNDRIEIVADKLEYAPGEIAQILVPSPFQGPVQALVTTERAGVMTAEVLTLTANSGMIEIPITEQHLPNVYVGVILAKGVDETNPFPAMRVGYTKIAVDTASVELQVEAESSENVVMPGDTVTYTLRVVDSANTPVPNAEVSVAIVDKAVLSLVSGMDEPLLDAFYRERPLDVTTGATLVINRDRKSQQLSEGAKGGGGGGGGMLEVRSDFSDVAFWDAVLLTDDDGVITFAVELPDSLTTWELIAKAVTDDTMVGQTTHELIATKELQVRQLMPRFLTEGDRPWVGVQVLNTSEVALTGLLTYTLTGAEFADGASVSMEFDVEPGKQVVEIWSAQANSGVDQVTALAVAVANSNQDENLAYSDAVQRTIPVNRYSSPETVATSGDVPADGVVEQILLPKDATDEGELRIRMEPNLASGMLSGLTYLQHYPYECNEQVVSRFLPNLVTANALHMLDIEDAAFTNQLSYQIGVGSQMLVTRQNPDGGWGYWPGEAQLPVHYGLCALGDQSRRSAGICVTRSGHTSRSRLSRQRIRATQRNGQRLEAQRDGVRALRAIRTRPRRSGPS